MPMYNPYWNQSTVNYGYNAMPTAQQRLQQMEQQYPQFGMSPTQMPGSLNCRMVDDFTSITADSIPMDSTGAVFVKSDGTEIQRRVWSNDGFIKTTSYKAILDNKDETLNVLSTNEEKLKFALSDTFTARFDEVMKKLEEMEKSITGKKVLKNAKSNANDVSTGNE